MHFVHEKFKALVSILWMKFKEPGQESLLEHGKLRVNDT